MTIAQEIDSRGIRSNSIVPGFTITELSAVLTEKVTTEWALKIPQRRGSSTDDIADVATYLASDMSAYISGQVLQVDGGMNM